MVNSPVEVLSRKRGEPTGYRSGHNFVTNAKPGKIGKIEKLGFFEIFRHISPPGVKCFLLRIFQDFFYGEMPRIQRVVFSRKTHIFPEKFAVARVKTILPGPAERTKSDHFFSENFFSGKKISKMAVKARFTTKKILKNSSWKCHYSPHQFLPTIFPLIFPVCRSPAKNPKKNYPDFFTKSGRRGNCQARAIQKHQNFRDLGCPGCRVWGTTGGTGLACSIWGHFGSRCGRMKKYFLGRKNVILGLF